MAMQLKLALLAKQWTVAFLANQLTVALLAKLHPEYLVRNTVN